MYRLGLISVVVLTTVIVGTEAVYIRRQGNSEHRLNRGESTNVEWSVKLNSTHDVTRGRLLFRHDVILLSEYNFETRSRSNNSGSDSDPRYQFIMTGIGKYGYNISNIQISDAGVYTVSYREFKGMPLIQSAADNITIFVYDYPTKPVISPQSPIMKDTDITFKCVSQSQSQPEVHRPEMQYRWYRNKKELRSTTSRYEVNGNTLTIRSVNDGDQGIELVCEAEEDGSAVKASSEIFNLALISVQSDEIQAEEVQEGSRVDLAWSVLGVSNVVLNYNHSLVFTCNGRTLAEYNLRFRHFEPDERLGHRLYFYSPGTGKYGFRLYNTKPDDIGEYMCTYEDEFGTRVLSPRTRVGISGYTFPVFTYTTKVYTTTSAHDPIPSDGEVPRPTDDRQIKPSSSSSSQPNNDANPKPVFAGTIAGVAIGCLVLLLIIILPIVLCRKKKKVPTATLR